MSIGPLGENLIFLISQPRAGSTLLQYIISGHPEICSVSEPWIMLYPIYALRESGVEAEFKFGIARRALENFLDYLPEREKTYLEAIRSMGLNLYNASCTTLSGSKFLDKTPRYYLIIPELIRIFPEAKFIFLFRNPIAVLRSILDTFVNGNWVYMWKHYYLDLLLAPDKLLEGTRILGDRAFIMHYETLVTQPDAEIERACKFLGLKFIPDMLDYRNQPSLLGSLGDPTGIYRYSRPSTDSLDRWKKTINDRQFRHFAKSYIDELGKEKIVAMGYDYCQMISDLDSSLFLKPSIVVPWRLVLQPNQNFITKFWMILFELLQEHQITHSAKQFGLLFSGRL